MIKKANLHSGGGKSSASVNKHRRSLVVEAAEKTELTPTAMVNKFIENKDIPRNVIPKNKQISKKGSKNIRKMNMNAPGDSPDELKLFLQQFIRPDDPEPSQLWVDMKNCKVTSTATIIPFTSDLILKNFAKFVTKGSAVFSVKKFLKLICDFTHNQAKEKLKKGMIGAAGVHFKD